MKRWRWLIPTTCVLTGLYLGVGSAWPQIVSSNVPQQGPAVGDLWGLIVNSGLLPTLLCFALWRVDSERRQLQSERDGQTERIVTALNSSTTSQQASALANTALASAVSGLRDYMKDRGDRGPM